MRQLTAVAQVLGCSLLLAACANYPSQQEPGGMVVGGLLGGVLGSHVGAGDGRTAAIILGSLVGASIGGAVGRSMAEVDRMKTSHALENVRTGVPTSWRNPDTGSQYMVVPTRTVETTRGPCRDYTIDAVIAVKREKVIGTACRQADGSWQTSN